MSHDFPRAGFDPDRLPEDLDQELGSDLADGRVAGRGEEVFDLLVEFSRCLQDQQTSEDVLDRVLDAVAGLRLAERVLIVLKRGRELEVARHRDRALGNSQEEHAAISHTVARRCLERNVLLLINDVRSDPDLQASVSIRELNLRSAACVPLRDKGEPIGVLYLDSQKPLDRRDDMVRLLEGYAFLSSLALTMLKDLETERRRNDEIQRERDRLFARIEEDWSRDLVGQSKAWVGVLHQIAVAKDLEHVVLIEGESGTGKELIARAISRASPRRGSGPFIALNCAGLGPQLLEATLFGTVKGAFTGAVDRPGYVEAAHGGILFLDEIGDMSMEVQQHFLRFLDNQQFRRVGSLELQESNVRIVAATNRNLKELYESGQFRFDLYNRINQLHIAVPPLRDRRDDIPLLVNHFLDAVGRGGVKVEPEALDLMLRYDWPGNVRQLKVAVEIAALSAGSSQTITRDDIETRARIGPGEVLPPPRRTLKEIRSEAELEALATTYRRNGGDITRIANELAVSRQTVYNLLRRYDICPPDKPLKG